MATIKLFRTLRRHYEQDMSDARAMERQGQPDAARCIHARALARWEELGTDLPEWIPTAELARDTGWSDRSLTDLAKDLQRLDRGLEQRSRKAGGQWQLRFDVALAIPMKGEAAFPEAEALRRPANPKEARFPVPVAASTTTQRTSPQAQAARLMEGTRR